MESINWQPIEYYIQKSVLQRAIEVENPSVVDTSNRQIDTSLNLHDLEVKNDTFEVFYGTDIMKWSLEYGSESIAV